MTETPESSPSPDALDEITCVEALLFASDTPLTAGRIATAAGINGLAGVRRAVETLNERYQVAGSAFTIEDIAGGYQMMTRPEYHDVLSRMHRVKADSRLSQATIETLAIVAYRQPILRADVEAIRGVVCGEILRGLMDKQLVKIVGRAEVIGRPMLYGTTRRFLEVFGLKDLSDLPRVEELRQPIETGTRQDAPTPDAADKPDHADGPDAAPDQDDQDESTLDQEPPAQKPAAEEAQEVS